MSTYELDDELVRRLVSNYDLLPVDIRQQVRDLEKQVPLPTPPRLGAIVRTQLANGGDGGTWLRWAVDTRTVAPWIRTNDADFEAERTDRIGRIVDVYTEGVDL